jgi:hypothetical protein
MTVISIRDESAITRRNVPLTMLGGLRSPGTIQQDGKSDRPLRVIGGAGWMAQLETMSSSILNVMSWL